jgi:hypothetical protein
MIDQPLCAIPIKGSTHHRRSCVMSWPTSSPGAVSAGKFAASYRFWPKPGKPECCNAHTLNGIVIQQHHMQMLSTSKMQALLCLTAVTVAALGV